MDIFYEHYKGGVYRFVGFAKHSETGERLVVYESTDDNEMWVRPAAMFESMVYVEGISLPRFRRV